MAKKKKKEKLQGQINFYKAMTTLGVLLGGYLIYMFLGAAPNLSDRPYHKAETPPYECMSCHVQKIRSTPIMPHRPMDSCTFCHSPAKKIPSPMDSYRN